MSVRRGGGYVVLHSASCPRVALALALDAKPEAWQEWLRLGRYYYVE